MFAGACVVVAALWAAQSVLIPLALSMLFTFLLAPLVRKLEHWRVPHVVAVMSVVLVTLAAVVAVGWVVFIQLNNLYEDLPSYREEIVAKARSINGSGAGLDQLEKLGKDIQEAAAGDAPTTAATSQPAEGDPTTRAADGTLPQTPMAIKNDVPPDVLDETAEPLPVKAATSQPAGTTPDAPVDVATVTKTSSFEAIYSYLSPLLGPLGTAGLVLVFVIFMLLQREDLRDRMIRLMGRSQFHLTTQALNDAGSRISRYILAQAIVNGTYGIGVSIGLVVIGYSVGGKMFPSFVLWGLLCALLRFIPYVGPWVGAAFPTLVAIAVYPGFGVFAAVVVMFIIIELLSNNLMEPWLYASSTGMNTLAILVSALFWTWLWGPVGLVLATPLTVCLVVMGKYVPQLQFLDILLGDEPVLDKPARVYQRLLAQDQEEAADLITAFGNEMDLLTLYDTVLLPALAMCETDRHAEQFGPERQRFIHDAIRDIIDETSDQAAARKLHDSAQEQVERAKGREGVGAPVIEPRTKCQVLCLPASDRADELVGMMLCELLEQRDYAATTMSIDSLAAEMIGKVEEIKPDVVVISALPPSATTRARYLCKRLQSRSDKQPMLVGLWTVTENLKRARQRLTCVESVGVVSTLEAAMEQLRQLTHTARIK